VKGEQWLREAHRYRLSTGLNDGEMWCSVCNIIRPKPGSATVASSENTFQLMTTLIRNESPLVLWRGLGSTLAMSIPSTAIYFAAYDELYQFLNSHHMPLAAMTAGMSARSVSAFLVSPIELLRTRTMAYQGTLPAGSSVARQVFHEMVAECRQRGIASLFRGLSPTLYRDVPFSGMYWTSYEWLKEQLQEPMARIRPDWSSSTQSFGVAFMSGCLAGMIASAATTPFDVAKTRRQASFFVTDTSNLETKSTFRLLGQIYREEGFAGLFRGFTPRMVKVAPACAIMISSYELGKAYFQS
jgi:solute carrier family 25 protein 39/40